MHCAVSSLEAKSLFLKFKIELKELSFCHKLQFSNLFKLIWYFKHRLFDLAEFIVWNIKGLRLENQSMWQKLNSFWSCFLKIWNQILILIWFPTLSIMITQCSNSWHGVVQFLLWGWGQASKFNTYQKVFCTVRVGC